MSEQDLAHRVVADVVEVLAEHDVEVRTTDQVGTDLDGDVAHARLEVAVPLDAERATTQDGADESGPETVLDEDISDDGPAPADSDDRDDSADPDADQDRPSLAVELEEQTPTVRDILTALRDEGECSRRTLERITGRSESGLSVNLSELQDYGLVESREDPDDGRRYLYSLGDVAIAGVSPEDRDQSDSETQVADGGGLVQPASASTTQPTCQNCGNQVTQQYARVFTPEGVEEPRACPDCEDVVRTGHNEVRLRRDKGQNLDVEEGDDA